MAAPSVVPMAVASDCRASSRRAICRRRDRSFTDRARLRHSHLNWKGCMALIVIKCPKGGGDVATGMAADWPAWNRLPPVWVGEPFRCPTCGEIHTWTKNDAWLNDFQLWTRP